MKKLLYLSLLLLLTSCSIINHARDNKAYARVIGDSALSARTYNTLVISHPCIIDDSALAFIKGEDTVTQIDSAFTMDTLSVHDTVYSKKIITVTTKKTVVDTAKFAVTDVRQINSLTAQNNNETGQISVLNTQLNIANTKVSSLTTQLSNSTSTLMDKWFWWFIGTCICWALTTFLLIYFKI
jgi:hypothetical protein